MSARWERERVVTAAMIAGMVAVVTIFLASAVYARWSADMTDTALSVATNGGPSVRFLAATRSELRELRHAASALILEGDSHATQDMRAARKRLDAALTTALETPEYPGERTQTQRTLAALGQLDTELERTVAPGASTDRLLAFEGAADRLDRTLDQLQQINARFMQRDADRLLDEQRATTARVYFIELFDVALAAVVTVLMIRLVRRHFQLARRRSRELEFFAVQVAHDVCNPLLPIAILLDRQADHGAPETKDAIERSRRSIARLRRTADQLLAFARADAPPHEGDRAQPLHCLGELLASLKSAASVEILDERPVHASEAALEAVLRALLREAARELDGASLRVVVRRSMMQVRVELHVPQPPGHPRLKAAALFCPRIRDERSGAPGIELDLVAAREIVEAHGGRVGVDERRDQRVLWLELPPG